MDYNLLTGALGTQSQAAAAVRVPNGKPLHSQCSWPNYGHFLKHPKAN